jgi:hypothetical protein
MKNTKAKKVRWSNKLKALKAISVSQPWAWLIANGYKDLETRTRATEYRGPVLIHANQNMDSMKFTVRDTLIGKCGIIGVVDIVDCVKTSKSPWHKKGTWSYVFANPRVLPYLECKGSAGFFTPKF